MSFRYSYETLRPSVARHRSEQVCATDCIIGDIIAGGLNAGISCHRGTASSVGFALASAQQSQLDLQMAAVRGLQQPKPFHAGDLVVLGGCSVEVKLYRPG